MFVELLICLLINCETNIILSWFDKCLLSNDTKATTFAMKSAKLYVPVAILSTQDNAKLLEQLKLGSKRIINWNKYHPNGSTEKQNQYLDFLIDRKCQEVNKLFDSLFEKTNDRTAHREYYFPTLEIKYYNFIINGKIFLISLLRAVW